MKSSTKNTRKGSPSKKEQILERLEVLKSDQKDESIIKGVQDFLQSKINTTIREYAQKEKRAEIKDSLEK